MTRFFKIAYKNLKGLTFRDILPLVKSSLFRDDPILIYALETSQVEKRENNAPRTMDIRKGNIEELEEINKHFERIPWEFQCHQYDGVKDFFIASNNEGIQHITWIYYQNDPNRYIRLGPKDAELKYGLTLPPFRGLGLLPETLKTIVRYLGQKGFQRVFTCVRVDNQPSIRGVEKAGFELIGKIRLRKVLGIQISKRYVPSER